MHDLGRRLNRVLANEGVKGVGKLAPWKTGVPNILVARINVSYWREQQIQVRLTQEGLLSACGQTRGERISRP